MSTFISACSTISTVSWRIQFLWMILFKFIYSTTSLTINGIYSTFIITIITHQLLWFLNTIFLSFNFFIDFIKFWVFTWSFWNCTKMVILVNHLIRWGLTLFFKRTFICRCFTCTTFLIFFWHVVSEFLTTKMDICIRKIHTLVVLIREPDLLNHGVLNFS